MDILKNVKNFIVKNKTVKEKQSESIYFYNRFTTVANLLKYDPFVFVSYLEKKDKNILEIQSHRAYDQISFDRNSSYWIVKPLKVAQSSIYSAQIQFDHIETVSNLEPKHYEILDKKNQKFITLFRNPYERAKSQLNFTTKTINEQYKVQLDDWNYFKESFDICPDSHSYPQVFFIPFEINGNFFQQVADEFIKAKDSLPPTPNPDYTLLTSTIRKALQNLDYTQILKESNHEYTYILIEPGAKPVQTLFKDYLKAENTSHNFLEVMNRSSNNLNLDVYNPEFSDWVEKVFACDVNFFNYLKEEGYFRKKKESKF